MTWKKHFKFVTTVSRKVEYNQASCFVISTRGRNLCFLIQSFLKDLKSMLTAVKVTWDFEKVCICGHRTLEQDKPDSKRQDGCKQLDG